MKPPYCRICDQPVDNLEEGLVCFSKTEQDHKWDMRVRRDGITGHPPYCDWFCNLHSGLAQSLNHLTIVDAVAHIRKQEKT